MTNNDMRAKLQSARQKCTDVRNAVTGETPDGVLALINEARGALEAAIERLSNG